MKKFLVVALLSLSLPAFAGEPGKTATKDAPATQRVRNFDFDADELKGEIPGPALEDIRVRLDPRMGTLIHPRADFTREILRTVDQM